MNLKKIKLKHLGFVIGGVLLLSGWGMRLIAAVFHMGTAWDHTINKIGITISGASVIFFLGGILFYAAVSSREQVEAPTQPLTVEQVEEKAAHELENASYEIKNSIPFTAVYGIFSILLTLLSASMLVNHEGGLRYGIGGLLVGLFLNQYYIRKLIRQFKWLKQYNRLK